MQFILELQEDVTAVSALFSIYLCVVRLCCRMISCIVRLILALRSIDGRVVAPYKGDELGLHLLIVMSADSPLTFGSRDTPWLQIVGTAAAK